MLNNHIKSRMNLGSLEVARFEQGHLKAAQERYVGDLDVIGRYTVAPEQSFDVVVNLL